MPWEAVTMCEPYTPRGEHRTESIDQESIEQPDLGAATKEVREALTALKVESEAKAVAAPSAAAAALPPVLALRVALTPLSGDSVLLTVDIVPCLAGDSTTLEQAAEEKHTQQLAHAGAGAEGAAAGDSTAGAAAGASVWYWHSPRRGWVPVSGTGTPPRNRQNRAATEPFSPFSAPATAPFPAAVAAPSAATLPAGLPPQSPQRAAWRAALKGRSPYSPRTLAPSPLA